MLGAAGGHADYGGNEVNALALNVETPAWTQICDPTPNDQILNGFTGTGELGSSRPRFNLDLKPAATHTYYATQFIDSINRMLIMAGNGYNGPATATTPVDWPYMGTNQVLSFNFAAETWDAPGYIKTFPGSGDLIACLCVKHQITNDVYVAWNGDKWWKWSAASNSWSTLGGAALGGYAGAAIDPFRQRMLRVGSYDGAAAPTVHDLGANRIAANFGGLGARALTIGGYPGVVYDEVMDVYLVAVNVGAKIALYSVSADSWIVSEVEISGRAPASRLNGIQNSIQYVPELRGIVIANSADGNVYFMRTAG